MSDDYLQHEVEQLQPVTMTLQVLHDVEIQNAQGLCFHVHTLEILETQQRHVHVHDCKQAVMEPKLVKAVKEHTGSG